MSGKNLLHKNIVAVTDKSCELCDTAFKIPTEPALVNLCKLYLTSQFHHTKVKLQECTLNLLNLDMLACHCNHISMVFLADLAQGAV